MILREKVTRVRAATISDDYGNTVADWSNAQRYAMPAALNPGGAEGASTENVVDQQLTSGKWRLILHPGADVRSTDRFEWAGRTFEVAGEVQLVSRRGRPHHLSAPLSSLEQG